VDGAVTKLLGTGNGNGADEIKILDPDYNDRKGYDTKFLGLSVSMPTLTVEAKKLGLSLEEVQTSVAEHWRQLDYKEAKEEA